MSNGLISIKDRYRHAVKIGEGGINDKVITATAIDRALDAIKDFKEKIDQIGIQEIRAFATSAIRNAENSKQLIDRIKSESNIEINVISGDEEAELIYKGIKSGMDLGEDPALMMDIGGGSVEFIIGNNKEIFWKKSYEIGAQRLIDLFHQNDPITEEEVEKLNQYLEAELIELRQEIAKFNPTMLIGSSGTFETLSDIYCYNSNHKPTTYNGEAAFDISMFPEIYEDLISKDFKDRLLIPGMIPLRAKMIVVAVVIVERILSWHSFKEVRVSTYSLKEGILETMLSR